MNELVIGTYIKILKDGFINNCTQESAAKLLFDSIAMQENANVYTTLNSKKISNLVSRKDVVPDDIKVASLKQDVVKEVFLYFKNEVIPDMNPHIKDDILEKLMNVIVQDLHISVKKKDYFKMLYDSNDTLSFLVETFLYSLQRNNKKNSDSVEPLDVPLLAEVDYKCPICRVPLVKSIKNIPKRKYTITSIFPENLSEEENLLFSSMRPKPRDLKSPANLIALSNEVSESYMLKPTVEEYVKLYDIKQFVVKKQSILSSINQMNLEEDIQVALNALMNIQKSSELSKLEYDALKIDDKIEDFLLQNEVKNHVISYYKYIESVFANSTVDFDDIAMEVKLCSSKLEKAGLDQEEVITRLTEWIYNKAFTDNEKGKIACRIIVCFFIQNCEVFSK